MLKDEYDKFINNTMVKEIWGTLSEFKKSSYHFTKSNNKIYIRAQIFHNSEDVFSIEVFDISEYAYNIFFKFYKNNIERINM